MGAKADLHIYSRYTPRTEEWAFRRIGLKASYSEPWMLYDKLKAAGMDFVTLTDINSIDGCLEIAERPDVFLSELVAARFPDSKATIKILVYGLSEAQHKDIAGLRDNLFDLQKYLAQNQIAHSVAHPFYSYNRDLRIMEIERLILLFKHFEGINGARDQLFSETARYVFARLNPQVIERLANEHDLEPTHHEPWEKILTGGSADRAGLNPATVTTISDREAATPEDFLAAVRDGAIFLEGTGGTPLRSAHSFYNILFSFTRQQFYNHEALPGLDLLDRAFSRFLAGENPTEFGLMDRINFVLDSIAKGKIFDLAKPTNAAFFGEILDVLEAEDLDDEIRENTAHIVSRERRAFAISNLLFNRLYFHFTDKFFQQVEEGNGLEALRGIAALLPLSALLSPYVYAFVNQAPNRKFLKKAGDQIVGDSPEALTRVKRAWFTDTLDDLNGVSMTIRRMAAAAKRAGADLEVIVSRGKLELDEPDVPVKNFPPVGEFELPEYEHQTVTLAPLLDVVDYVQRKGFTEIIISTPGPIGLTGLAVAKILGLKTITIYHTDFPQYMRILTDDHFLESVTWKFMHWFYDSQDLIYVNSEHYRRSWLKRNILPEKLKILPRGLNTELFHPTRRDPDFFTKYGAQERSMKLLYIGRISREKDLDVIVQAARKFEGVEGEDWELIFVGHGPYVEGLKEKLPHAIFPGPLYGEDLATAYAGGDIFLFPSTTDTFGNVVIEAHACGLPVVVSDLGGPCDLVRDGENGFITRALNSRSFANAVNQLMNDAGLRKKMGEQGRKSIEHRNWDNAFAHFWKLEEFATPEISGDNPANEKETEPA